MARSRTDVAIHDDCFAFRHDARSEVRCYYFQTSIVPLGTGHARAARQVEADLDGEPWQALKIPVPPLRRAASASSPILDKFDALVNDLSIGCRPRSRRVGSSTSTTATGCSPSRSWQRELRGAGDLATHYETDRGQPTRARSSRRTCLTRSSAERLPVRGRARGGVHQQLRRRRTSGCTITSTAELDRQPAHAARSAEQ